MTWLGLALARLWASEVLEVDSIPGGLERQRQLNVQETYIGPTVNRTMCELTGTKSAQHSRLANVREEV